MVAYSSASFSGHMQKGLKIAKFMPFGWDVEAVDGVINDLERKKKEQAEIDNQWAEFDKYMAEKK